MPQAPSGGRVPRWAVAADALVLFLLALAASVAIFGGIRTRLIGVRLTISTADRLLAAAAVAFFVRHAVVWWPPLPVRLWSALRNFRRDPPEGWGTAFRISLTSRLAVLLVGYFAVMLVGYGPTPVPFRISDNEFLNLSARWDAGWYLGIAREGYIWNPNTSRQQNVAFFPAFPTLMWLGSTVAGARPQTGPVTTILNTGLAVSLAAFTWALVYLFRLAREQLTEDEAFGALLLLAAYPFAVFFSAPYTEALFLLSSAAAFYHLRRRAIVAAACWGLLAGLARPNGCLLSVPLGLMALGDVWPRTRPWLGLQPERDSETRSGAPVGSGSAVGRTVATLTAAAMPGVGMLLFSAYVQSLTGRPFAWAEVHGAWGRQYKGLDELITERYEYFDVHGLYGYLSSLPLDVLNSAAAIFALAMAWPVARRFGLVYAAFIVVNVIPPLVAGGTLSMGRLTSVLFPMFFALAARLPPQSRAALAAAFAVGQGLVAVMFFTWRPMF
jgi:hypothetical protein